MPKVKGTKVTITCFGPVISGSKMGFPYYQDIAYKIYILYIYIIHSLNCKETNQCDL